jgi:acetyltransferase-like isoleucine patch superfamily enzyme
MKKIKWFVQGGAIIGYKFNILFLHHIKKKMKYGKYTYGTPNILWNNPNADIIIGKFCSIAKGVNIYLGGNHRTDRITTYPFGHIHKNVFNLFDGEGHPSTKGNVTIGNDVWIGQNVTIMSGVTIGDGVVIANNSHVVKNIESYALVGGNPAKLIKYRFTEEQIIKLLQIKWWDWDDKKINNNTHLLCSDNIDDFINNYT